MSDLEEERRKLRLEVKFRAKYHGKAALEMGLSPEQLLLLEEYVDGLKGGRNPEERLVTQLQQRVGACWCAVVEHTEGLLVLNLSALFLNMLSPH